MLVGVKTMNIKYSRHNYNNYNNTCATNVFSTLGISFWHLSIFYILSLEKAALSRLN